MQELKESKQLLSNQVEKPILAIDFGDKRIGLAISDSKGVVSAPLEVVHFTEKKDLSMIAAEVAKIALDNRAKTILLGLPQAFEKSHEKTGEKIKVFAEILALECDLPIVFHDESYSTSDAQNMLLSLGQNSRSTKHKIDMVSAALFLQEFLDGSENNELQTEPTGN